MKKGFVIIWFLSVLILGCLVCPAAGWVAMRGSSQVVVEERAVSNFTGVNLATFGNLYIEQGDHESLRIEAEGNVLPYLETEVSGHTLEIRERHDAFMFHTRPVNFYLAVKTLDKITLSGSGDVKAPVLTGERLSININGSGQVKLGKLDFDKIELQIDGSGEVTIAEGEVDLQQIIVSGSGDYEARGLVSNKAEVYVSGSGATDLQAHDYLAVVISGSGDVYYTGSPTVEQVIMGSGEIKPELWAFVNEIVT